MFVGALRRPERLAWVLRPLNFTSPSARRFYSPIEAKRRDRGEWRSDSQRTSQNSSTLDNALSVNQLPLRYFVTRTKSKNLPVYEEVAKGGNQHNTRIRKIDGDVKQLMDGLKAHLNIPDIDIHITSPARHILLRGWRKKEISEYLESKSF